MSQEHFNRSLSPVTKSRTLATVKWTFRAKIKVTMTNGGEWHGKGEAIVIRRSDIEHVHDFARVNCKLRDFLLIRVPMKIGLRTTEIRTLNIEDIDFQTRSFRVLDSKKKRFYPLPLDVLTLQFIQDLIGNRAEGTVFTRQDKLEIARQNKPMSRTAIWYLIHGIGVAAGVEWLSPRSLRHYFACKWHEDMKKQGSNKTLVGLQRILRHKNLATTTFYLARLVFFEDIQQEFEDVKNPYFQSKTENNPTEQMPVIDISSEFYEEYCSSCIHEPVCSIKQKMCSCEGASGCRFYKPKKEVII